MHARRQVVRDVRAIANDLDTELRIAILSRVLGSLAYAEVVELARATATVASDSSRVELLAQLIPALRGEDRQLTMHRSPAEATALIEKYLDQEAPESRSLQDDLDRVFDDPKIRQHQVRIQKTFSDDKTRNRARDRSIQFRSGSKLLYKSARSFDQYQEDRT